MNRDGFIRRTAVLLSLVRFSGGWHVRGAMDPRVHSDRRARCQSLICVEHSVDLLVHIPTNIARTISYLLTY